MTTKNYARSVRAKLLNISKEENVLEGTKRSVYLRESPKMVEEPRIEIVR